MAPHAHRRRTLLKYLAFQVPGWVLLPGFLLLLRPWVELPWWIVGAVLAVWVVKDLALYPFLYHAYEEDPRSPAERLIGTRGVVVTPLAPRGYIRVRGELWRAEIRQPARHLPAGAVVRVCAADGLTLAVEPD